METIGLRELRQHASRYLARVESGESFAVTNRGRVVAKLVSITGAERSRQALIDAGVLIPAASPADFLSSPPIKVDRDLGDVLDDVRGDR